MSFIELLLIAVGLSMDAFAIAICKGLSMKNGIVPKQTVLIALFFGGFQALMPLIGYILGSQFESYIKAYDHWVAFVLLAFIGGKMLYEGIKGEETEECVAVGVKALLVQGVATSIDALSVGFTIADYNWLEALLACLLIGVVTFIICFAGLVIGKKAGTKLAGKAGILGGIILIAIGLEICFYR